MDGSRKTALGPELIFDESQKECDNEIWIDLYALTRFLAKHTQPAEKQYHC